MYLVHAPRTAFLDALPKGAVGAEVGVLAGTFAREILQRASPRALHLIDAWRLPFSDWRAPPPPWRPADVDNFDTYLRGFLPMYPGGDPNAGLEICHLLCQALALEDPRVTLHRGLSVEMAARLPDGSLDFVYVDADHTFEGCLADLNAYAPKIKTGGLILGHDFYELHGVDQPVYGVIGAVQAFCRRQGWLHLALNGEQHATFVLCRTFDDFVAAFVRNLLSVDAPVVELPGGLAAGYHTKLVRTPAGPRRLPSFLGTGEYDPWPDHGR